MFTAATPAITAKPTARSLPVVVSVMVLAAILGVLFFLQLRHFSPFMTDDAYISLRYSQRLLEGHGLTWNDMRPVEGYTNFLWVLLCAGLGALGMPLPAAAHWLGIVTTLAMLVAISLYCYRSYSEKIRFFAALIAGSALVLSSPFSMWSLGGLEQPLLACMLVWAAYLMLRWLVENEPSTRTALGIGLLLGLACISRADAALFTAAYFAAAVIADGISVRSMISRARILPIPILFFLGQLAFRKFYYHEWLPNTAFVKVAFTAHRLHTGVRYVCYAIKTDCVFLLLAVLGGWALWHAGKRKTVIFLSVVTFIWTVYLVLIGGDIFPAYRHFEPLVALLGFMVAGCALLVVDAQGRWKTGMVVGVVALTALVATSDAMSDQEHWELEGESLGLFLNQAFGAQQPLLSSDAAGVVPFYAHMPALDPLGLNDYHIAHEASRARGYGWVGHELGDGKYILDQKPDLLLFADFEGAAPLFPADQQLVADPRFAEYYQQVRFDTPQPNAIRSLMYLRRIDGKLGMTVQADRVVVPAYLEEGDLKNSIHLVDGKAALVLPPQGTARFAKIPLAAGTWTATIQMDGATPVVFRSASNGNCSHDCPNEIDAKNADGESFSLMNRSASPVAVRSITLTRK